MCCEPFVKEFCTFSCELMLILFRFDISSIFLLSLDISSFNKWRGYESYLNYRFAKFIRPCLTSYIYYFRSYILFVCYCPLFEKLLKLFYMFVIRLVLSFRKKESLSWSFDILVKMFDPIIFYIGINFIRVYLFFDEISIILSYISFILLLINSIFDYRSV